MAIFDLKKQVAKAEKKEKGAHKQVDALKNRLRELGLQLEMRSSELKMQQEMQKVTEDQLAQLRRHIETLSMSKS